jgi:NRAMP (natural resistance-associated macrophage protein)-like metal ion transporter
MSRFSLKKIGPGPLIAAAFIGPGTVTLCSIAGVHFGFALLWAMVLSVIATIVLQEMSARLGLISDKGLAEVIRDELEPGLAKTIVIFLVLSAIVVGNAAYEAGNISGGVLGLSALVPESDVLFFGFKLNYLVLLLGFAAFLILMSGSYKVLERSLFILVLLMSLSFVITAILTRPDPTEILKGAFLPRIPKDGLLTVIGLIGTTVVPYNLFLHSSLVREKWKGEKHIGDAVRDTVIAVVLGGLVSMAIIISAAASDTNRLENAVDLARSLGPLYGDSATVLLALGLFAAGITSAVTAPLAAAFVARGIFGWEQNMKSKRFRAVWMAILMLGVVLASLGIKPIEIIKFAQVANGIMLPVISGFLLWVMNRHKLLGSYANNRFQNISGLLIFGVTLFLGLKTIWSVFSG